MTFVAKAVTLLPTLWLGARPLILSSFTHERPELGACSGSTDELAQVVELAPRDLVYFFGERAGILPQATGLVCWPCAVL
jgi:hypothetical protein